METITNEKVRDRGASEAGVLYSICRAIPAAIDSGHSTALVAAVAVQSHKVHGDGHDTLQHLDLLFESAYNKKTGRVIEEKMRALAAKVRNIFIMVDEVTGATSGAAFLRRVVEIVHTYRLREFGFNLKIIVADASIVDPDVVARHLSMVVPCRCGTSPRPTGQGRYAGGV